MSDEALISKMQGAPGGALEPPVESWHSRARRLLRSNAAGAICLAILFFYGVLLWQIVVGWPLTRRAAVVFRKAAETEGGSVEGRIKADQPVLPWNSDYSRIWLNGQELTCSRTRERFQIAPAPAAYVKGRRVVLRLGPGDPTPTVGQCTTRISWLPSTAAIIACAVSLCASLVMIAWAGNPFLAKALAVAGRVPLPGMLCLLGFTGAVLLRFAAFSFAAWHPDSTEFLKPAADLAAGRPMSVTDRPLGYSVVVGLVLRLVPRLHAIVVMHQLSSLIFAVSLAATVFVAGRRLFASRRARLLTGLLAACSVALWSWNEGIIFREWQLIPEALIPAYVGLQFWFFWRLVALPLPWRRALLEFGLFCILGWVIFHTKPNWGLALLLLPIPWITATILRTASGRELLRWNIAGGLVFVLICLGGLVIPRLTPENTRAAIAIRSRVFICWHLDMVRPEIDRRLAANPPANERVLLEELAPILDEELDLARERGAGAYPLMGYDPDRLYYYGFLKANRFWQLSQAEETAFCQHLFYGALRHHPFLYLRHVGTQASVFFRRPYGPATVYLPEYDASLRIAETFLARPRVDLAPSTKAAYQAEVREARTVLTGPWPSPARYSLSVKMGALFRLLGSTFAAVVIGSVGIVAGACLWPFWRKSVPWPQLAPVLSIATWAFGTACASALSSSLAQALEIQRYIDLFMPVTLFSNFIWPLVACFLIGRLVRARR